MNLYLYNHGMFQSLIKVVQIAYTHSPSLPPPLSLPSYLIDALTSISITYGQTGAHHLIAFEVHLVLKYYEDQKVHIVLPPTYSEYFIFYLIKTFRIICIFTTAALQGY